MRDSVVEFIEKYHYLILAVVFAITIISAIIFDFGRIDLMSPSDKKELARLTTSLAFPMTGIMIFVLGQTLSLRKDYTGKNPVDYIANVYIKMSAISATTLVASAIIGLLSFQYFKSGGDIWLIIALYLFLSILILLIVSTIFFAIYTLGKTVKNMRYYLR